MSDQSVYSYWSAGPYIDGIKASIQIPDLLGGRIISAPRYRSVRQGDLPLLASSPSSSGVLLDDHDSHYKKFGIWWQIKFVSKCMFFLTNDIGDKTGDKIISSTKGRHKKSPRDKIFISSPIVIVLWRNLFRHL